ncbi:MAG: choice-of-anchor Q domain-containing protein, partial [Chloroflexota bacterium]|nr:choice-of-anchor Q domain-containing protein [Chloroflexota bacterium]
DAATGACPSTDQRGVARPQGPACDVGAYEFGAAPPPPPPLGGPRHFVPLASLNQPGG